MLQASVETPAFHEGELHLLVVSDDRASRQHLVTLAKRTGYESINASEIKDGLTAAQELSPDLVMIEGPMPAMECIDLVRALRANKRLVQPYVILVVNREDESLLATAFESGVDDLIRKPLRSRIVAARLRTGHRLLALQRENERQLEELRRYAEAVTRSNRRLRELALTDELTSLPNRRYAMERLQLVWAAAERNLSPLSCLAIDLDGLKEINELHGHERGDVVLKTIAAMLRERASSQDIVSRIGGDEFLVICPNTSMEELLVWSESLMAAIGTFHFEADGYPLGLSIGAAERHPGMAYPQELICQAEQQMYRAKRKGRNRVCIAETRESIGVQ